MPNDSKKLASAGGLAASRFQKKPLAAAISALSLPAMSLVAVPVNAEERQLMEEVVVTATRRSTSVQDVPLNIAVLGTRELEEQGITDLAEVGPWVPGLHIVDQGSRGSDRIVVRGLNADPLQSAEGINNDGGGTVATYLGEIPLYVDLKLNDIERVEVLLGPQGTLYGAGTMGGAIRYIPTRPQLGETEFSIRGDVFSYSEADDLGGDFGATVNIPLGERAALRANLDYLDDPGFIDYNRVVRQIGVSNPDPDLTNAADVRANLREVEDANTEETLSGRVALRVQPTDSLDAVLSYYFQENDVGARGISHKDALGLGDYESGMRVLEPNETENELIALELTWDLDFAELTAAAGYSKFEEEGNRDQTDLLISLEYSYEAFPNFTSFTLEEQEDESFTAEVRLVSTGDGPLSWIVGGFYNDFESDSTSKEFTPNYDVFAVNNFGGVGLRPDSLEYFSVSLQELEETALFGEITYQITDAWQVTVGGRWYEYELETQDAVDFPLLNTVFFGDAPDAISLNFEPGGQDDDGFLFKFNTSYHLSEDAMIYLTVSEGYRIGNSNGVAPCPNPLPPNQIACALPNEVEFFPDETQNLEVGLRSQVWDGRLTLNGAVFLIDWTDPQVSSATENALIPITINGDGAESRGIELSFDWRPTDNFSLRGNYAFTEAELTDTVPNLVPGLNPPGFQGTISYTDGLDGDRLPGSPEHMASLFASYDMQLSDGFDLTLNYGVYGQSDVLTRTASKGGGEELSGYVVHNASAVLSKDNWDVTLYAKNLTDKYAETGARDTSLFAQTVTDINGDPVQVRRYYKYVLPPRQIGLRFTWNFGS